ncbi:hypothetical protein LCGC14_0752340 [marine sediment metagenome]|uniref:Uncharacterized protein n=1 Tax=marine sediment metagenome TaxID=412755 RepID=A0A0F9Q7T1_9ZZZZ
MNKESKESIDKVVELVDKNIDRLVEKIAELGPEAAYGFNEIIAKISVEAWTIVFMVPLVCFASWTAFYKAVKYGIKKDWDGASFAFGVSSGILCLFSTVGLVVDVPRFLAQALHPVGYFLLEVLK